MGGRAHWGPDDTPGWSMMSDEERLAHRRQLDSFTDYESCHAYMEAQHARMATRAREQGRAMPARPRRDACGGLRPAAR